MVPLGLYEFLATLVGIGLLIVVLRWAYGTSGSLPDPPHHDPDDRTGHGLLQEVSRVPTESAAQLLRSRLNGAGIRSTIGFGGTEEGYRLLVFPADVVDAKVVLSRGPRD